MNHGGVIRAHEVNAFAAVVTFVGFEGRLTGTCAVVDIERLVVVEDIVVGDGDVRATHNEDALKISVLDLETGNEHVRYTEWGSGGETVNEDAVGQPGSVDRGMATFGSNQESALVMTTASL